jgi:hypothetical protein
MPWLNRFCSVGAAAMALSAALFMGPAQASAQTKNNPPVLVLTGGTVVDVSDWGHSAKDLANAVVVIREGHIAEVGPAAAISVPKGARILDCSGKFLIPGLIDGYAGMNSLGQAFANLAMGVTTVVAVGDRARGAVDVVASPSPHLYLVDSVGVTNNWSLLAHRSGWSAKLREGARPVELSPEDTKRQIADSARAGARVLLLGPQLTAANTQWIIARAHQLGLITYGEFAATPYSVAVNSGVDVLLHHGRYILGVIPDELQRPLVDDQSGAAASTAYDYAEHLPPADLHLRNYARFLASHHAALMPAFATSFAQLPGHRNLWREPAAHLIDPSRVYEPTDRATGEMNYALSTWSRHLPNSAQRWLTDTDRKKAEQSTLRVWQINEVLFSAYPHYLAASGAPYRSALPGISLHVELEMLVRLGLTPREALAAATNNYAEQFHWYEIGQISPGRHADILILDADPTAYIWNARRISAVILDGQLFDREALLNGHK